MHTRAQLSRNGAFDGKEGKKGRQEEQGQESGEEDRPHRSAKERHWEHRSKEKSEEVTKLQDYRETYYTFSGKTSDIARQLGFAAIAIVWLFKVDVGGRPTIPPELFLPSALVAIALLADGLQYFVGAVIWERVFRYFEKKGVSEDEELKHDDELLWPMQVFYYLKIGLIALTYVLLIAFLVDRVGTSPQSTVTDPARISAPNQNPSSTPR